MTLDFHILQLNFVHNKITSCLKFRDVLNQVVSSARFDPFKPATHWNWCQIFHLLKLFFVFASSPSKLSSLKSTFASRDLTWLSAMTEIQRETNTSFLFTLHQTDKDVNTLLTSAYKGNNLRALICTTVKIGQTLIRGSSLLFELMYLVTLR